jgi:starvation-inducible DNA-binding protein
VHGEQGGSASGISERDGNRHLAGQRRIVRLEFVHFDNLLVEFICPQPVEVEQAGDYLHAPNRHTEAAEVRMYPTKNDLPEAARTKLVDLLNARLADAIDLQTQCKQAHWNVKGPDFIALHKLFDEVNEAVEEYVDLIAERAVQLGGVADGTARVVAKRSSLPEYAAKEGDGRAHVEALSAVLSAFGKVVRAEIDRSNELSDADTADLFTEVSRGIDKWLWFVEAHLQAAR